MPCEILTKDVLTAALKRHLPAEQRAVLLRHLREPCEGCLDLLEGWPAEELILAADDQLFRRQPANLFAAAPAEWPVPGLRSRLASPWQRRLPRLAWGLSAAALVLVGLITIVRPTQRNTGSGLKGAAAPSARLIPLAGARSPTPHVVRALAPGARLAPGELLLLRIRLDAPAWVYLLAQKQDEPAELIWPLNAAEQHGPGEFELAESGSALAIDPSALGVGGRILLIASPEPIDRQRLEVREPLLTREKLERAFPGCGVDFLPMLVEAR
jgi:hypothetical protein